MAYCRRPQSNQGTGVSLKGTVERLSTEQDFRLSNPKPGSESCCKAGSSSRMSTSSLGQHKHTVSRREHWSQAALVVSTGDSISPLRSTSHLALTTHYHHRGASKAINCASHSLLNLQQDEGLIFTCCSNYWDLESAIRRALLKEVTSALQLTRTISESQRTSSEV